MKGMPYTATRKATCTEVQPDGSIAKGQRLVKEWRDSQGRIRRQEADLSEAGVERTKVDVFDPVAHITLRWTIGKDPHPSVVKLRYKPAAEYPQWQTNFRFGQMAASESPTFKDERLPKDWVNGVYAVGDRYTSYSLPAGPNAVRQRKVSEVVETWVSVDLGEVVRHIDQHTDGNRETEDMIISDRSEPDPALFAAPADHELIEFPDPGKEPPVTSNVFREVP